MSSSHSSAVIDDSLAPLVGLPKDPFTKAISDLGPGMIFPFQTKLWDHKGEQKLISSGINSVTVVSDLMAMTRYAVLKSLEVVFFPAQATLSIPCAFDVVWTPNEVVPATTEILSYTNSTRVVLGGATCLGSVVVPCDFNLVNPVIKSPLSFSNYPRLSVNCWLNTTANDANANKAYSATIATIIIRGELFLSQPSSIKG